MNFIDLPEEILILIIRNLDIKSLYNLYTACEHVRNLIRIYGIIKKCDLSLSVMATAETFKLNFFKDMSRTLKELNISGVPDLSKTTLLLAVRRLKCLMTLNVAYTNIDLLDLVEIYKICPSIKNICINFTYNVTKMLNSKLQLQEIFENFLNVHFVGHFNLLYSHFPFYVLQKARLQSLQYTVAKIDRVSVSHEDMDIVNLSFDNFTIDMLQHTPSESFKSKLYNSYGLLSQMPICPMLSLQNYEILIIMFDNSNMPTITIYSSLIFKKFFHEHFNENPKLINEMSDLHISLERNFYIQIWNKNSTMFDDNFFSSLWYHLKGLIHYHIGSSETPVPSQYEWYINCPPTNTIELKDNEDLSMKKKRIATPNYELNYDTRFKEISTVRLIIVFNENVMNAVNISPSLRYLRKLTYLSLSGIRVRYSAEFFNILFRCCEKLVTLNIDVRSVSPFCAALSRSLPLSQSLRNLRLVDKRIDLQTLFSSMSQCKTLENVHIIDPALDGWHISDPTVMFEKCVNLYCLYLYLACSKTVKSRQLQILKKAKATCKKNINVNVLGSFNIDPYCNVFNTYTLKRWMNI